MTITADQVMTLTGIALNDVGNNRWQLPELCQWINEAVKAIVLAKPSSTATSITLNLAAGTYQTVGTSYLSLLRVVRNISAAGPPRVGGRFIAITSRDMLDSQVPYWHDSAQTPYKKEVRQVCFDEETPRDFYVYPGNDATGIVEVVVSKLPTAIAATGDAYALASYTGQDVGLPDIYLPPLLDYVLYRALSKDSPDAAPQSAMAHYQVFATALGIRASVEAANSPNRQGAAQAVAKSGGG